MCLSEHSDEKYLLVVGNQIWLCVFLNILTKNISLLLGIKFDYVFVWTLWRKISCCWESNLIMCLSEHSEEKYLLVVVVVDGNQIWLCVCLNILTKNILLLLGIKFDYVFVWTFWQKISCCWESNLIMCLAEHSDEKYLLVVGNQIWLCVCLNILAKNILLLLGIKFDYVLVWTYTLASQPFRFIN
jgi:hypothetical protein